MILRSFLILSFMFFLTASLWIVPAGAAEKREEASETPAQGNVSPESPDASSEEQENTPDEASADASDEMQENTFDTKNHAPLTPEITSPALKRKLTRHERLEARRIEREQADKAADFEHLTTKYKNKSKHHLIRTRSKLENVLEKAKERQNEKKVEAIEMEIEIINNRLAQEDMQP